MSWKRHLKTINTAEALAKPLLNKSNNNNQQSSGVSSSSYSSQNQISQLYSGHPNRLQRYKQFEDMDKDSIVNTGLNIISDFCTQSEEHSIGPFFVDYDSSLTDAEVKLISKTLKSWVRINNFTNRLYGIFRGVLALGDQFFITHPETREWIWVNPYAVQGCSIDPDKPTKIDFYHIRSLDVNMDAKLATLPDVELVNDSYGYSYRDNSSSNQNGAKAFQLADIATPTGYSNSDKNQVYKVDAKYVVHLTTNNGMNSYWPFGTSVLEAVYQTYKQKQLIEDAVLIYRVQYAPVRRVFNIAVGEMNTVQANAYLERFKNENHQRRTAGKNGSLIDSAYNPLSMLEDYYFAKPADGEGSSVELLQGGDQVGEISDLSYWDKKLRDGLGIPSTYMAGVENAATYNDGKVGAAMIQEFIFTKMCMRIQNSLVSSFDKEFKIYLEASGLAIDEDSFSLKFNPPQNFQKYRQAEIDSTQVGVYTQLVENKFLSERFKLERFLNLTPEEILRNERLWAEENPSKIAKATGTEVTDATKPGLEDVGINEEDPLETDDSDASLNTDNSEDMPAEDFAEPPSP